MRLPALIHRELLVQSRKRGTYDARLAWGLAVVALLGIVILSFPAQLITGRLFLGIVHGCLAVMFLVVTPVGAADAISREKREGTLGLLLLTRITPTQLVLGKLAAHFVRSVYLGLMMVPFLVVAVLLGGISLPELAFSVAALVTIIVAGLTGGLLASSLLVSFGPALFWSFFLAATFLVVNGSLVTNSIFLLFSSRFPENIPGLIRHVVLGPAAMLFPLQTRDVAGTFFTSRWVPLFMECGFVLTSLTLLRAVFSFCARHLARHGENQGETRRQAAFRRQFFTPLLWRQRFRRSMARRLDRNPFIWLEYRTAWSRASRSAMLLILAGTEAMMLIDLPRQEELLQFNLLLLCILLGFLTLKSCSSFQIEKESGAFELLLVTPLTERKIVHGRLSAVASYYRPTVLLLVCASLLGFAWTQPYEDTFPRITAIVNLASLSCSLFSAPACGLFFALRSRTFLNALLRTVGVAILAPVCTWYAVHGLLWMAARQPAYNMGPVLELLLRRGTMPILLTIAVYHLWIASYCRRASIRFLSRREIKNQADWTLRGAIASLGESILYI